jgi:hypothetical protein
MVTNSSHRRLEESGERKRLTERVVVVLVSVSTQTPVRQAHSYQKGWFADSTFLSREFFKQITVRVKMAPKEKELAGRLRKKLMRIKEYTLSVC